MAKSSTNRLLFTPCGKAFTMSFIAMANSVPLRTLPSGTPSFSLKLSEYVESIRVWKVLSLRKFLMKIGKFPLSPLSYNDLKTEYRHVVSYAFCISNKIATVNLCCSKPFLI